MPQNRAEITESSEDERPLLVYVDSGDLYMNLDKYLAVTKDESFLQSFIIKYKDKVAGVLQDPGVKSDAPHLPVEIFRSQYHYILDEFLKKDTGFTITIDGKPAAYFASITRFHSDLRAARDFLLNHVKKQERQTSDFRSRISGFFGRFGRGGSH